MELRTGIRFAGGWGFFAVAAILIANLDTDCIFFFNIFVYQIGLAWTTKSRNQSWGCALFLLPHANTDMLLSSERKDERSLASQQFYSKGILKTVCWMFNFADTWSIKGLGICIYFFILGINISSTSNTVRLILAKKVSTQNLFFLCMYIKNFYFQLFSYWWFRVKIKKIDFFFFLLLLSLHYLWF